MLISFRPILKNEVDQLRRIGIKTFEQSYEHLNKPSNFQAYLNKDFEEVSLLQELENVESLFQFIVMKNDVIGYLKLNIG